MLLTDCAAPETTLSALAGSALARDLPGSSVAFGPLGTLETAGPMLIWAVVLTFAFLECALIIGLFLPGDSMLITAGIALAANSAGEAHIWALSVATMVASIAGNQVGFGIGRRAGSHLLARRDGKYLNAETFRRVAILLERHGFVAVLIARWIPWVRTLCPLVAGAAGMDQRRYTIASAIGSVMWAPVLLLVSFYAGVYLNRVPWLLPGVTIVLVLLLVGGTILGMRHYRQEMARPAEDFSVADDHRE